MVNICIFNEYMLSKNNPNSIRNKKLKEDLKEKEERSKPK